MPTPQFTPTKLANGDQHFFSSEDGAAEVLAIAPENLRSFPPPERSLICFRVRPADQGRVTHLTSRLVRYEVRPDELLAVLEAICAADRAFQLQSAA